MTDIFQNVFIPDITTSVFEKLNQEVTEEVDSECSRLSQGEPYQDSSSDEESQQGTAARLLRGLEEKVCTFVYMDRFLCNYQGGKCDPSLYLIILSSLVLFRFKSSRSVTVTSLSWFTTTTAGTCLQLGHREDWTSYALRIQALISSLQQLYRLLREIIF